MVIEEGENLAFLIGEEFRAMYYRWGPYFEADCQNPAYVQQLQEESAYQRRLQEQRDCEELQRFWDALAAVPSYVERFRKETS